MIITSRYIKSPNYVMIESSEKVCKGPLSAQTRRTVQRIKATKAAKTRLVLPAAVMRSAPFLPDVVGETVALEPFESVVGLPELPGEVVLAFVVVITELDEDVESEAVMLNVPDCARMVLKSFASLTKLTWKPSPVWKPLEGTVTGVVVSPAVLLIVILLRMLTNWEFLTRTARQSLSVLTHVYVTESGPFEVHPEVLLGEVISYAVAETTREIRAKKERMLKSIEKGAGVERVNKGGCKFKEKKGGLVKRGGEKAMEEDVCS